jgi:hypothetical protein
VYDPNSSRSWRVDPSYYYYAVHYADNNSSLTIGTDTLGIGSSTNGPSLTNQTIVAEKSGDHYVGLLGLNPKPVNWSLADGPYSSFLYPLRLNNVIPSTAFGYTAGAAYSKN